MARDEVKLAALSPAETEVLAVVWGRERATVGQVCEGLAAKRQVSYATVQTLLRRLEKKGYLRHETEGKAHVFFAAVGKTAVIERTVGDFVERLFGGDPLPLMMHLANHDGIGEEDIEKLKALTGKEAKE